MDYHAGGKRFIHGPKRRKENQLLILSIACKYAVHGNLFSPLFQNKVRGQKHPRKEVKNRNSTPNVSQYITSKDCQHPV